MLYADLNFPEPPEHRPYVFVNMVATIDGKILTGERDEPVMDLGSKHDHETMRRLEAAADAVMVGAGVLRATKGIWYRTNLIRIVVTASGNVPFESRFFTNAPAKAFIVQVPTPRKAQPPKVPPDVTVLAVDLPTALGILRKQHGVRYLLSEGGSELNASLLSQNLVDELFLTVAPKIKLGRDVPTYAGGEPLSRADVQKYTLLEVNQVEDEVFLRYRRR